MELEISKKNFWRVSGSSVVARMGYPPSPSVFKIF